MGGDCPYRAEAWGWVRPHYSDFEIHISERSGEWSKSAAVMDGVDGCSETIVIADSDCWTDGIFEAIEKVEDGAPWAMGHGQVHRLTKESTAKVLAGASPESLPLVQRAYQGVKGGGIVAVRREILLDVPWDRRYVGWGRADLSWRAAMTTLHGDPWRGSSPLFHLWHPPMERQDRTSSLSLGSEALYARYTRARGNKQRIRALLEEDGCVA